MPHENLKRDFSYVLRGRDRVTDVLLPYLVSWLAMERANNIAQALGGGCVDQVSAVIHMLRNTGIDDLEKVTKEVVYAWNKAMQEH